MFNLIRRDVILQKRMILTFIPFILLFVILGSHHPAFIFLLASIFIPFNAFAYDEKAEVNILLNSLPYTRSEIIASRYLGAIVYMILSIGVTSVALGVFNRSFTMTDMAIGGALFLIFAAFTFPLFYILKPGYISMAVIIGFIVIAGIGPAIGLFMAERITTIIEFISSLSTLVRYVGAAIIVMMIYGVSWVVSTIIYQRKAF